MRREFLYARSETRIGCALSLLTENKYSSFHLLAISTISGRMRLVKGIVFREMCLGISALARG